MAGMPALFEPLRLGGIALANRNAVSPMCHYSAENGAANDWHLQDFGSLSLSGSDHQTTNIGPGTTQSVGGQFKYPPVGGGHLTGG